MDNYSDGSNMEFGQWYQLISNMGWKCPGCGRCFAPHVNECAYCQPAAYVYTISSPEVCSVSIPDMTCTVTEQPTCRRETACSQCGYCRGCGGYGKE